jgi:hypothetical protein
MARPPILALVSYGLGVALLPSIACLAAFAATCALECSALPWLSFIVGPCLGILAVVVLAIFIYKKSIQFEADARRVVRIAVLSSVLWGWPAATYTFGFFLWLAQKLA